MGRKGWQTNCLHYNAKVMSSNSLKPILLLKFLLTFLYIKEVVTELILVISLKQKKKLPNSCSCFFIYMETIITKIKKEKNKQNHNSYCIRKFLSLNKLYNMHSVEPEIIANLTVARTSLQKAVPTQ